MTGEAPTHIVELTGQGRGAIASLRVEGPRATEWVAQSFRAGGGRPLREYPVRRIIFGRWVTDETDQPGEELVVARLASDKIEVHCHGGRAAVERVTESLLARGATRVDWPQWLAREENDPLVVDAAITMAQARTERAAVILLDQYGGALRRAIERLVALLGERDARSAAKELRSLLDRAAVGLRLTDPWRVVLAGRPNVGKSSLINAMLGYRRAIVDRVAGTTRDVLTAAVALDGWPVELADTAGLRTSDDALETAGVRRAKNRLAEADVVLLVFDGSKPLGAPDRALAADFPHAIAVHNKCDLPSEIAPPPGGAVLTSAKTGEGIDRLIAAVVKKMVPHAPCQGDAVPFTPEQVEMLRRALAAVESGKLDTARGHLETRLGIGESAATSP